MFLQASTTVPVAKAASSSVGDPGSTRLVYLIVVVLVLLGAGLGFFAFTFWKRTRPGTPTSQRREADRWNDPRPQPRFDARREPQAMPARSTRPTGSANRQWWDEDVADDQWPAQQPPVQRRPAEPRPEPQRPVPQSRPPQQQPARQQPAQQQRPPAPRDPLL